GTAAGGRLARRKGWFGLVAGPSAPATRLISIGVSWFRREAMSVGQETAFPRLSPAELAVLKPLATAHDYVDGETVFRAGQADIDFFVVESGQIDILNPTDGNRVIVAHDPGQFSGDIDLLTRRPAIVTALDR